MNNKFLSTNSVAILSVLLTACSCNNGCNSGSMNGGANGMNDGANGTNSNTNGMNIPEGAHAIFFEYDSTDYISDESKKAIASAIETLKTNEKSAIVTAHCSLEGSESYNYGLADRRANLVADALKSADIKVEKAVSYGKSIDFGDGFEKNRRAYIFTNGSINGLETGKAK